MPKSAHESDLLFQAQTLHTLAQKIADDARAVYGAVSDNGVVPLESLAGVAVAARYALNQIRPLRQAMHRVEADINAP